MIGVSNTVLLSAVSSSVILSFLCSFIYRLFFTVVAVIRGIILGLKDAVMLSRALGFKEYLHSRVLMIKQPGRVLSEILNFIYIILCGILIIVANYILLDGVLRFVFPIVFILCFIIFSFFLKKPITRTVEYISRILVWTTLIIVYIISKTVLKAVFYFLSFLKKEIKRE